MLRYANSGKNRPQPLSIHPLNIRPHIELHIFKLETRDPMEAMRERMLTGEVSREEGCAGAIQFSFFGGFSSTHLI